VANRMIKVAALQARAHNHHDARQLLFQMLRREPLSKELDSKVAAAERASAEKSATPQEVHLSIEDRKLFDVAVLLVNRGSTPPWPALIVSLLNSMSERATRIFGTIVASVDPQRARPSFSQGSQVLVWSEEEKAWEKGSVRGARGRGMYEVQPNSGLGLAVVPTKHIMHPTDGGLGAVLYESARKGSYLLVDCLLNGGVSPFECDSKGNTALHIAVRRGHAPMCKRLVMAGADPEVPNMFGTSAWDLALQCGQASVRRVFSPSAADRDLEKRADVSRGATALMAAAAAGDVSGVATALDKHPTAVDETSKSGGTTALMLASRRGDLGIVTSLLRASASVAGRSRRGATALSMAAEEGHAKTVAALLAAGAETDVTDDDGFTALGVACENGHAECARALLLAGSDPNLPRKNGWTSLITASYNGNVSVVRVLIENDADPSAAKKNGFNAMIAAAYNGFDDVLTCLLDAKASADTCMTNGWSALMIAAAQSHASTVGTLCEAGAAVDYGRPLNGFSALMAAASTPFDATCANILLQHRASVDLMDKERCTALMYAAYHGHTEALEVLLQAEADAKAVRLGGTSALMDAAAGGHEDVVASLLLAKANVDAADAHGLSALMHAARAGHDSVMVPMVQAKASLNMKDKEGKTALAHAVTAEVADRLILAGADARSRKDPFPEPRSRARPTPSPALVAAAEAAAPLSAREGRGGSGRPHSARGGADDGDKASKAGSKGSPWGIGVESHQKRASAMGAKDFLRVRPRKEDSSSGRHGTPTFSSRGRRANMGVLPSKEQPKPAVAQKVESKQDKAAKKLQALFKARFAAKLRAEAKLFGMLSMCKEQLNNHWET
jgi:ankyrin repeat protein